MESKFGMTVEEASRYTSIGRNTLRALVDAGKRNCCDVHISISLVCEQSNSSVGILANLPFDGLDFIHIEKVDTFVQIQEFDKDLGTDDIFSADAQNGKFACINQCAKGVSANTCIARGLFDCHSKF